MNTLNQLKNIFSNIVCLHLQEREGALVSDKTETKVDESDQYKNLSPEQKEVLEQINLLKKELDWVDATKKITWKAWSYLSNKLKNDPEALTDPEAKPTIELLQRYKRQFNEALNSSRDITKEIQELKENVAKLADKFVSDNWLLEETAKESEKPKESEKGIATEKSKEAEKSKLSAEKLQTITNQEFLSLPREQRLQYVTKDNVDGNSVASWNVEKVEFNFTFDWKFNRELYQYTTAWQVLPREAGEIINGWEVYFRKTLDWEFFTPDNKRLIIHDGTNIKIWKLRTSDEIWKMTEENQKKIEEYLKNNPDSNKQILTEAINRWIDPKFALNIFWDLIKWITDQKEIDYKLEDAFTEFDRIRWRVGWGSQMEKIKKWDTEIERYDENIIINLLKVLYPSIWKEKAISNWFSDEEITNFEKISNTEIDFSSVDWDVSLMIEKTAESTNIDSKLIRAILKQESNWNMSATRFEKHVYDRNIKKWISPDDAKLLATSFWWFQIMWFNYETCWYNSVNDFVEAMKNPENQFNAFIEFVKTNKTLYTAMTRQPPNFQTIAYYYNWPLYAQNNYDKKISGYYYA